MEQGKDFRKQSNDPQEKLWKELRKLAGGEVIPVDSYQDWQ